MPGPCPAGGSHAGTVAGTPIAIESAQYRLPTNFTSAVDPVDGNPFAAEEPRHAAWAAATLVAEEELHRRQAEPVPELPTSTTESVDFFAHRVVLPALDAWARRGLSAMCSEARAFAQRHGWSVADDHVFLDDAVSGAEFGDKRPALQRLLRTLNPRHRSQS